MIGGAELGGVHCECPGVLPLKLVHVIESGWGAHFAACDWVSGVKSARDLLFLGATVFSIGSSILQRFTALILFAVPVILGADFDQKLSTREDKVIPHRTGLKRAAEVRRFEEGKHLPSAKGPVLPSSYSSLKASRLHAGGHWEGGNFQ